MADWADRTRTMFPPNKAPLLHIERGDYEPYKCICGWIPVRGQLLTCDEDFNINCPDCGKEIIHNAPYSSRLDRLVP